MTPEAGQLVARLREQRGMTQRDLADAIGVAINTVSRGENGHGRWYPNTCRRIYDTLNTRVPLQEGESLALLQALDLSAAMARRQQASGDRARFSILPHDIETLVSQMIYVVGPDRVAEYLQAGVNLMAASDDVPAAAPASLPKPGPGVLASDFEDPESGLRGKMYTPASPKPPKPPASRRRKSG